MMHALPAPVRRAASIAVAAALVLALSACLLSPGRFASTLDIRKDGRFRFTYAGEIHLLPLSEMARKEMGGAQVPFEVRPCHAEDSGAERPCTRAEAAEQRKAWEAERAAAEDKRKRDGEMAKAMFGGIDFDDPKAAEELAARLRRQAGWRRVDYKGNGLFDVDYTISGTLSHDFAFPTVERFPAANPFVTLAVRNDGTIRLDAPGYTLMGAGEPMRAMAGLAALGAKGKDTPGLPMLDGHFTLTTDGTVLANNTEEGAQAAPEGQSLNWKIDANSAAAPMAVLRLSAR